MYYRDLVSKPETVLEQIGAFSGLKQIGAWQDNFATQHDLYPEFFAAGSDERKIAQMTEYETKLFWQVHGAVMVKFGFAEKIKT